MKTITELQIDNILDLSDSQIANIATYAAYHTNVLIRNQNLSKEDYAKVLRLFGTNPKRDVWFEDKDHHEIMYVTNKLKCGENGDRPGVFSRGELNWHQNGTMTMDPEDCVVLYAYEPSDVPSNTYFTNGVLAYNTLPNDVKKLIENTELMLTADTRSFHKLKEPHFIKLHRKPVILDQERVWSDVPADEIKELWKIQDRCRDLNGTAAIEMLNKVKMYSEEGGRWNYVFKRLVHKHIVTGIPGLFFPFSNVVGFHDIPENEWQDLFNFLHDHYVSTSEVVEWQKGDLMLFDNTQGLHKRDLIPEGYSRELWRGAFWYN